MWLNRSDEQCLNLTVQEIRDDHERIVQAVFKILQGMEFVLVQGELEFFRVLFSEKWFLDIQSGKAKHRATKVLRVVPSSWLGQSCLTEWDGRFENRPPPVLAPGMALRLHLCRAFSSVRVVSLWSDRWLLAKKSCSYGNINALGHAETKGCGWQAA